MLTTKWNVIFDAQLAAKVLWLFALKSILNINSLFSLRKIGKKDYYEINIINNV